MTREEYRAMPETAKATICDAYERALEVDRFLSFRVFLTTIPADVAIKPRIRQHA